MMDFLRKLAGVPPRDALRTQRERVDELVQRTHDQGETIRQHTRRLSVLEGRVRMMRRRD